MNLMKMQHISHTLAETDGLTLPVANTKCFQDTMQMSNSPAGCEVQLDAVRVAISMCSLRAMVAASLTKALKSAPLQVQLTTHSKER